MRALAASIRRFPPRQPLDTRVIKEYRGDGYRRQDLFIIAARALGHCQSLFFPLDAKDGMPGIVIAHSLHAPKTKFELQVWHTLGRAGCAVLVMDQMATRADGRLSMEREFYHSAISRECSYTR